MTLHNPISVFTPSRSNPEDLEAIMVQRHDLLTDAVERIEESASTDNKHHLLFVGPRGTGKTHLMTLLVHRLSTTPNLHIAWLNEDETSTTLIEFLLRIYTALQKRYPLAFSADDVDPIYDLPPADAERELIQVLLEKLQSKSLLVVVENLDALFEGLGKEGQQKLRAFIQEHPVLSIVATAQRLVEGISKRSNAFFGFFQIENLKPLTVEEAAELLSNIARHREEKELADFIQTPVGLSRIRALHHLSGGNHRIYIVLSQFITSKTIDLLVEPFAKMIDEMTPYYQERIRWLPPQQRKIVEFLCNVDRPATVKQIARRLFTSNQTISSQLKDLRGKGYVQAAQRGRESLYEITEPLMRICVEVKENQNIEPLKILVDFLRVWYDGVELSSLLEGCESSKAEYAYLMSAISKNAEQGSLRAELLVDRFRREVGFSRSDEVDELKTLADLASLDDGLGLGYGKLVSGDIEEASDIFEDLTKSDEITTNIKIIAYICLVDICVKSNDSPNQIRWLNEVLHKLLLSDEDKELFLGLRIDFNYHNEAWADSLRDIAALLKIDALDEKKRNKYILQRSEIHAGLGNEEAQIEDLSYLIDRVDKVEVDRQRKLYFLRGSAYSIQGYHEKANDDFKAVLALNEGEGWSREEISVHTFYMLLSIGDESLEGVFSTLRVIFSKARYGAVDFSYFSRSTAKAVLSIIMRQGQWKGAVALLVDVCNENDALLALTEELINLLGVYLLSTEEIESDLELWAAEWEAALSPYPEASISLRIFRTGIEFLKSGGVECSVLLSLHQEERRILEQVFQLED
jgi:energy-coupling factor transporter ATP-binding protein EcfA2